MKYKMSLISFVLLAFVINILLDNTEASTVICFTINSQNISKTFEFEKVTYAEARESLKLTASDSFLYHDHLVDQSSEKKWLVQNDECNVVINQSKGSSVDVCIAHDHCKKITIKNNANVNDLRNELLASLPGYYRNDNCTDIVFLDDRGRAILRPEEVNTPFHNIVDNGKIAAHNRFIDNTTLLHITWRLNKYKVRVNMMMPLSNLRYWIMKPNDCPNLKEKLNLPDEPLFPIVEDDLAQNWLARNRYTELDKVPHSSNVTSQLVAPYDKEHLLPIYSYIYKIKSSDNRRLYYVDISETQKAAFTGSRAEEFKENNLRVTISPYWNSRDITLLMLKDVRSTNHHAISWTNVVIATNNTQVAVKVNWDNHQDGYAYLCELFDYRAGRIKHRLYSHVSQNGECRLDKIYDAVLKTGYDLIFNQEKVIENGEDLTIYRYELGVAMYPHRPGSWARDNRRKRDSNIDIHQDDIRMGGAQKGSDTGNPYTGSISLNDMEYAENNKRSLYFNVFIFKSQEIAEKIIEDIPAF